jgi:hypothetical protein
MSSDNSDNYQNEILALERRIAAVEGEIIQGMDILRRTVQDAASATIDELKKTNEINSRMEIAKQIAKLNSISPIIDNQTEILQKESDLINLKIQRIVTKYDGIENVLKESYLRDIRRLGAHIYDILENGYKKGIEERLSGSRFDFMSDNLGEVEKYRREVIAKYLFKASEELSLFTKKRMAFRKNINKKSIQAPKNLIGQDVTVPFWIIKYRDNKNILHTRIIAPCILAELQNGHCKMEEVDIGFDEIKTALASQDKNTFNDIPAKNISESEKRIISSGLEALSQSKNPKISASLKNFVLNQIKKRPLRVSI